MMYFALSMNTVVYSHSFVTNLNYSFFSIFFCSFLFLGMVSLKLSKFYLMIDYHDYFFTMCVES